MSTLHERLLARIHQGDPYGVVTVWKVVRGVVELHAPEPHKYIPAVMWCGRCNLPANQCVEARAIAEALGIGETPK